MFKNAVHVFDCDGVILDSNNSKIEALQKTLSYLGCPNKFINWACEKFRGNFGLPRAAHFEIFSQYKCPTGFRLDQSLLQLFLDHYGLKVQEIYSSCPFIEETISFISKKDIQNIYVVSASDQIELRNILPNRLAGIETEKIYGGPIKKSKNLQNLVDIEGLENIVFYGDSVQDAKAAIQAGVTFIGLYEYSADADSLKYFCKQNNLLIFKSCLEINL